MPNKLKIFTIITVSFLTVQLLTPQIFLANTPRINPLFIARLKDSPYYLASLPGNILSYLTNTVKNTTDNIAQNTSRTIGSLTVKTDKQISSLPKNSNTGTKNSNINTANNTHNNTQTSLVFKEPVLMLQISLYQYFLHNYLSQLRYQHHQIYHQIGKDCRLIKK
jgi:hypothetical protein